MTTKSAAIRTGRNPSFVTRISTLETLFHADFTVWTNTLGIHTVDLSSGVAGVCLVGWTSTRGRGNLEGDLPAGSVSPGDLPRPRLGGCSATGGVCGRSLLGLLALERSAGVIEVAGTDLVRRTLVVDVAREGLLVRSTGRRWTSGDTEGHLLRAPTSVSLRRKVLTSVGRHGERLRATAADWPATGLRLPPVPLVAPAAVPFLPLVLLSAGVALQEGGLADDEARASEKMAAGFLPLATARDLTLGFDSLSGMNCRIGSSLLYADFTPVARATTRSAHR